MPRLRVGTKLADDNHVIPDTNEAARHSVELCSKPRPPKRQKPSYVSDGDENIKRTKEAKDDDEKNVFAKIKTDIRVDENVPQTGRVTRKSSQVTTNVKPKKVNNIKSNGALAVDNPGASVTVIKEQVEVTVNDDNSVVRETSKKTNKKNNRISSTVVKTEENKESGEISQKTVAKKPRAPRSKAAVLVPVKTETQEVVLTVDNIKKEVQEDLALIDSLKMEVQEEVMKIVDDIKLGSSKVSTSRKRQSKNKNKLNVKTEPLLNDSLSTDDAVVRDKKDVKIEIQSDNFAGSRKFVGAHTSIAGSLSNAILETTAMGGKAFGMFLKSSRTWKSKPLSDEEADKFKTKLEESGIEPKMVVPHGSYLLNCGSSNAEVLAKSRDCLVDELLRCEKLGLPIYNFHPGSSNGVITVSECIARIVETINYAHSRTVSVITVIENMSCQGNTVGGKFSELREMIDGVKDKSRVGVCLDTCHAFAAGYDIQSESGYEMMKAEFESVIGRQYLKAVHLNDSKGDCGNHLDRHENIGKGKIGLAAFRRIMNDPFFDDLPMILETPEGDYGKEIRTLYGLCKSEWRRISI